MRHRWLSSAVLVVFLGLTGAVWALPLRQDLAGVAKSLDTGKFLPFLLQITSLNESSGEVIGQITWKTLGSVHTIEGILQGDVLDFTETAPIKEGKARLGVSYRLYKSGTRWEGNWTDPAGDKGAATMEGSPENEPAVSISLPLRKDLAGDTKSSRSGRSWSFLLRITSLNESSGEVIGQITWKTPGAVHKIEGSLKGDVLEFSETARIKKGQASLNAAYRVKLSRNSAEGTWKDPSRKDDGTIFFSWK